MPAATLDKNGQPKRKRNRRRKRRLSLSSSSSSSSSESEAENPPAAAVITNGTISAQEEASSSEESSSESSSSESDIDPTPVNFDIPVASTSTAASVLTPFAQPELSNRQRSPSPPYFGFPDFDSRKRNKPILWGELEEDKIAEPTDEQRKAWDEEQAALKKHYLEVVVNKFGKELDDMRKEPGVPDRLGMLISSLSQGASLMETAALAEEQQQNIKSIWARTSKAALPAEVGVEALEKQQTNGIEAQDDVEMAS